MTLDDGHKYRIVIVGNDGKEREFPKVSGFVIEPGRAKIRVDDWREYESTWYTIEDMDSVHISREK